MNLLDYHNHDLAELKRIRSIMGLCVFSEKTEVGSPVDRVFKSFTDTEFLVKVFPARVGLHLQRRTARYLGTGCSVMLEARFFGLPLAWVSYVNSFSVNRHFSYVWQKGPLQCWEHDFYFESISNGTRVTECILYRFPVGKVGEWLKLGQWFNTLYFREFLKRIYRERNEKIRQELAAAPANSNGFRPANPLPAPAVQRS